ncbi:MAG: hypothetical protein ACQEXO_08835 [Pseudomonadota bacterium]
MRLKPYEVSRPFLMADPDPEIDYFGPIQEFSAKRLQSIARSVIHHFQRIPAEGIFEGHTGRPLKTLWDEWCWYQEKYDNDFGSLSSAFEQTLDGMISGTVADLSQEEAVLMSCAVCEDQTNMPARSDDEICAVVRDIVTEAAGCRSLERFEVY